MHSSRSRSNCQCLNVCQRARGQAAVGRLHSSPSRSISIERLCRGCAWATAIFFRCKKRGVRAMRGRSTKHKHAHHQRVQPWPSASRPPPPPLQEDSFSNDNCESTRSVNTQTMKSSDMCFEAARRTLPRARRRHGPCLPAPLQQRKVQASSRRNLVVPTPAIHVTHPLKRVAVQRSNLSPAGRGAQFSRHEQRRNRLVSTGYSSRNSATEFKMRGVRVMRFKL